LAKNEFAAAETFQHDVDEQREQGAALVGKPPTQVTALKVKCPRRWESALDRRPVASLLRALPDPPARAGIRNLDAAGNSRKLQRDSGSSSGTVDAVTGRHCVPLHRGDEAWVSPPADQVTM